MKVLTVIGARPQIIKAALVSKELIKTNIDEIILHTGQHYDKNLSEIFFTELTIPKPKYNLRIGSASHAVQTANMMIGIEKIISDEKPDCVLLYGDTNSTIAGSLTAIKMNVKIAHIESGVRRYLKSVPEEINRKVTDHISDIHFVTTQTEVNNLRLEGINEHVYFVGDLMYELALKTLNNVNAEEIIKEFDLQPKKYIYCTIHRPENTDDKIKLNNILESLYEITNHCRVILPLHPRTKKYLNEYNIKTSTDNKYLHIIDPISYTKSLALIKNSICTITDSGGIQRESYFLKQPCIVLNSSTPWKAPVELGWNKITGADKNRIINGFKQIFNNGVVADWKPLFGDGNTAEKIIHILKENI